MLLKTVMCRARKETALAIDRSQRTNQRMTVVMTWVFATAAMLMMAACDHRPVLSQSHFVHISNDGWLSSAPVSFKPEYADSNAIYSLALAYRHTNSYAYSNLSLVVDVIDADSIVNRRQMDITLADEYGNWRGGGFGALYQDTVMIAHAVEPDDALTVVVWQTMQGCDTLMGLTDIGLIVKKL